MSKHATAHPPIDELRAAFTEIVADVRGQLGPAIAANLLDVQMRFGRDWVGDDAAYVDFVFEFEPQLEDVTRLRDAIVDRARDSALPFMVYVSPVLRSELETTDDDA